MILFNLFRRFGDPDEDIEYYQHCLTNTKAVHEFVFVSIESLKVLGALLAAWRKSGNGIILSLYFLAYGAIFLFTQGNLRLALHAAAYRYDLPEKFRAPLLWISRIGVTLIGAFLPYVLGLLVKDIIANKIMM